MSPRRVLAVVAFAVATMAAAGAAEAANIVQNGDFESGFTDWTSTGWYQTDVANSISPYEGNEFAAQQCVWNACSLSQTLNTTPGVTYDLSFAFNPGNGADWAGADTKVYWDGAQVADMPGGSIGWTVYNLQVNATTSATSLVFSGYQNAFQAGLDAVSVTSAAGAVPEPATWALMIIGVGAAGAALRRRRPLPAC